MTKRRDLFIFVAEPNRAEEARHYLGSWLRELDGHPGYLGGYVLQESAGELLDNTLVLALEFESTEAARALWPKIENTINPLYPDDKSDGRPDQGPAFFDGTKKAVAAGGELPLAFTRGNGLLARMLHIHAEVIDEFSVESALTPVS
ncbi:hypothetical protein EXU48_22725 [Occultella glacieicola]|uniref:ABM domain-containing protein n=1 Tax=Occultella glacieicola TaxID=2518684 RepID=A0ABY2DY69_9MICO|nr:hypothetical protein [Occultella glacieicola]TDE88544.1 hypothetical protein EXU48_22725 [Occultella glacieicola]